MRLGQFLGVLRGYYGITITYYGDSAFY
jgi:hypothetical protein